MASGSTRIDNVESHGEVARHRAREAELLQRVKSLEETVDKQKRRFKDEIQLFLSKMQGLKEQNAAITAERDELQHQAREFINKLNDAEVALAQERAQSKHLQDSLNSTIETWTEAMRERDKTISQQAELIRQSDNGVKFEEPEIVEPVSAQLAGSLRGQMRSLRAELLAAQVENRRLTAVCASLRKVTGDGAAVSGDDTSNVDFLASAITSTGDGVKEGSPKPMLRSLMAAKAALAEEAGMNHTQRLAVLQAELDSVIAERNEFAKSLAENNAARAKVEAELSEANMVIADLRASAPSIPTFASPSSTSKSKSSLARTKSSATIIRGTLGQGSPTSPRGDGLGRSPSFSGKVAAAADGIEVSELKKRVGHLQGQLEHAIHAAKMHEERANTNAQRAEALQRQLSDWKTQRDHALRQLEELQKVNYELMAAAREHESLAGDLRAQLEQQHALVGRLKAAVIKSRGVALLTICKKSDWSKKATAFQRWCLATKLKSVSALKQRAKLIATRWLEITATQSARVKLSFSFAAWRKATAESRKRSSSVSPSNTLRKSSSPRGVRFAEDETTDAQLQHNRVVAETELALRNALRAYDELKAENASLQELISIKSKHIEDVDNKLMATGSELESLQQQHAQLLQSAAQEQAELEHRYASLAAEHASLSKEFDVIQELCGATQQQLQAIKEEYALLETTRDSESASSLQSSNARIITLTEENSLLQQQLRSLLNEVQVARAENSELSGSLAEAQQRAERIEAAITAIARAAQTDPSGNAAANVDVAQQLAGMLETSEKRRQHAAALEADCAALRNQVKSLELAVRSAQESLIQQSAMHRMETEKFEGQMVQLDTSTTSLKNQLATNDNELRTLRAAVQVYQSSAVHSKAQLDTALQQVAQLQAEISELKIQQVEKPSQPQPKAAAPVEEEAIGIAEPQAGDASTVHFETVQRQLEKTLANIDEISLIDPLDVSSKQSLRTPVETCVVATAALRKQHLALQRKHAAASEEKEKLAVALRDAISATATISEEFDNAKSRIAELQRQVNALEAAQTENTDTVTAQKSALEVQTRNVSELNAEIEALKAKLAGESTLLHTATLERNEARSKLTEVQSQLDQLLRATPRKSAADAAQLQALQTRLDQLQTENAAHVAQQATAAKQTSELQASLQEKEERILQLQRDASDAATRLERLKKEAEQNDAVLKARITSLEAALTDVKNHSDSSKAQLAELHQRCAQLQEALQREKARVDEMQEDVEREHELFLSREQRCSELEINLARVEQDYRNLRAAAAETERNLRAELGKYKDTVLARTLDGKTTNTTNSNINTSNGSQSVDAIGVTSTKSTRNLIDVDTATSASKPITTTASTASSSFTAKLETHEAVKGSPSAADTHHFSNNSNPAGTAGEVATNTKSTDAGTATVAGSTTTTAAGNAAVRASSDGKDASLFGIENFSPPALNQQ